MSNYADLPGGFSLIVVPIKRRTTQRLLPALRGSFYKLYQSANPSVSLVADSSLCTREPWVGASGRYCRRPSSCAFLGQVLQNHQFDPEKAV